MIYAGGCREIKIANMTIFKGHYFVEKVIKRLEIFLYFAMQFSKNSWRCSKSLYDFVPDGANFLHKTLDSVPSLEKRSFKIIESIFTFRIFKDFTAAIILLPLRIEVASGRHPHLEEYRSR
jgi:hypothetical protein